MSNRQQCVWIGASSSNPKSVDIGVPQGSVLGPLLFLVHINDLVSCITQGDTRLFADDTGIFTFSKSLDELFHLTQTSLENLRKWLLLNKLTLNLNKTHYILFSSRHIDQGERHLILDDIEIQRVESVKYLGLHLDECLKWNHHIASVCRKLAPIVGCLWRVRKFLGPTAIRLAYFSLVQSHLSYGIEFWGSAYDIFLDPLVKLQKRAIRCCTFSSYLASTESLFRKFRAFSLRKFYLTRLCFLVYKEVHKISPNLIGYSWFYHRHRRRLRSEDNDNLVVPQIRTNIGAQNIAYIGARVFNLLPDDIKHARTFSIFKSLVRSFFFDLDIDFNEFLYMRSIR